MTDYYILDNAYRKGYMAGMAMKPKAPPLDLPDEETAEWVRGYDNAVAVTIDSPIIQRTLTR